MGKTSIEWTDHSWPIVNGCRRISPGCGRARGQGGCYAERLISTRLSKTPKYQGLAVFGQGGPRWTGETRLWHPHLDMPLRLRTPSKIFVADMGDLFYEGVSDRDIDQVFGVMWACRWLGRDAIPGHVFQVLTKRADRMRDYLSADRKALARRWADAAVNVGGGENPDALHDSIMFETKPHPRIWLGVSVESPDYLWRVDRLLETQAAVRFVSAEPLLAPLRFRPGTLGCLGHLAETFGNPLIHQVIVGGESGPGAFPMPIEWVRDIRDQCKMAGAAFFFKQWGGVRKKLAGRELDGRTWDEMPTTAAATLGGRGTMMSDSIRERQKRQPWTVPYAAGVKYAQDRGDVPHILASHCALHAAKTVGKLAAVFEAMDHPARPDTDWGPSKPTDAQLQTIKDMAADLFVEALRFANLYGFDLADEHARRVVEKNGGNSYLATAGLGGP